MSDAELDARVHALSQQLRCLVCQNQTLADSNADLAVDLRRQMRAQLAQGASDTAIKEYLVQRYGDFVLYDPPFKRSTWLLWLGPFGLLVGVAGWLWWRWRRLPS
ncbi:MAG: cytochrome c-type biogenesis protein CcmH, partial [Cupriavidus sp.]|nr:cytochrome c-type biogenesis protein CcmH [Cupriavidus sp.]